MLLREQAIMDAMTNTNRQPRSTTPPDHAGVLAAAVFMAAAGWIGLWLLVTTSLPTAFPRWLFFVCLYLAVTGTAIPFVRYLNVRFTREVDAPPSSAIVLRQSIWIGLFVVACAWLQIPRVLNPIIAFFLALSLILVEFLLHMRENDPSDS